MSSFLEMVQLASFWGLDGDITGALATYNLDVLILPTNFAPAIPPLAEIPIVLVLMGAYPKGTSLFLLAG